MSDADLRPDAASDREKELSRRKLSSDRKVAFGLFVALSVAAVVTFASSRLDRGSPEVAPSLLQYTLLSVNVLLLFALSFSLLRYLIRLVSERRAGTLGSRFKLKLVATFIGLCLVPAFALYAAAISVIFQAVDRALTPEVDRVVDASQAVVRQYYQDEQADLGAELQEMVAALGRGLLVNPQHREDLRDFLVQELDRRRLAAARLYFRGSTEALDVLAPGAPAAAEGSVVPRDLEAELRAAHAGEWFARMHRLEGGAPAVLAGGPVVGAGRTEPVAVLVVARRVPADLAGHVRVVAEAAEKHAQSRRRAPWVKAEQALLFLGFSLVIILGATWVALYIARSITVPIQRLAQGTREVRSGNLGYEVAWRGSDELAELVGAFNEMSEDLRGKAAAVQRTTGELREANLALEVANAELARRRDEMEALLQTMTAGVLAADGAGRVLEVNRAAREILHLPEESLLGRPVGDVLAGEALAELRDFMDRSLGRLGLRQSRELVLAGEQGPVHLQVVLTSPATAAGSPVLLALFEDVTELVRAQKLAAWRAVARRIAHEIKNPLTPIQLSAQRILKKYRDGAEDLPEALEAGVQTIVAEVGGLKQMVDEFSQFARMPEVRPVAGDLAAMLRSVAALYGGHERLRVELRLPDELPGVAFDPDLLRRAIVNLLDNAVEATGGRGHVVVACEAEADGRGVRITVADDGPGVPRDDREKLFLPYFTTKKRGTGLGLAIVNRIVSDHDGRIRVEANRPRGARFVLTLPLATEGGPAAANPATAAPGRPA